MKQDKINGFNEKQIFQLYAYLVAYEEAGIEKYNSTKAMLEEHPELLKIDKIVKPVIRHHVKSEELTNINFNELHNENIKLMSFTLEISQIEISANDTNEIHS